VVQRDVTRVASHYPLVTGLFFKIMNQPELRDHYPWLLDELFLAVTHDIIMTLGRLFESTEDERTACLTTFLLGVEAQHATETDLSAREIAERGAFIKNLDVWRPELRAVNKRLAFVRNADLAHNDLTKVGRSDITWVELKAMIALAEAILKQYFHAFRQEDQRFVVMNTEWEIRDFLRWTRLDDYASHRARERDAKRAAFKDWLRRRNERDPTVPDQPPI
jgi:hypothetical protein